MADLKQTLANIAKAIVDTPDDVMVTMEEEDDSITLTLMVNPDDMGMVIGRHGKIAKAIRTLMPRFGAMSTCFLMAKLPQSKKTRFSRTCESRWIIVSVNCCQPMPA